MLFPGIELPLAEEAWQPVLFGGLIPVLGALAIGYILYRAVRDADSADDHPDDDLDDADGDDGGG